MKLFLSHSHEDQAFAETLSQALEARGFELLTMARLNPGVGGKSAITQAVSECEGFLFVVGRESEQDRWQQLEWQTALESDWDRVPQRPMVPILLGDVMVPAFLADRVALRVKSSADVPVDRIAYLLLNPEETHLPVNYDKARREQEQRLDVLKRFALSLKLANQHPEGYSFKR